MQDATDVGLNLITDPAFPTRIGTSVTRDTTPDLTFVKTDGGSREAKWRNTGQELGSDHYIVEVVVPLEGQGNSGIRKHRITDWDTFRNALPAVKLDITDIEQWAANVLETMEGAIKELETGERIDKMDSRLAHLIEAKQSIKTGCSEEHTTGLLCKGAGNRSAGDGSDGRGVYPGGFSKATTMILILVTSILMILLWAAIQYLHEFFMWRRAPLGTRLPPTPPASPLWGHNEVYHSDFHCKTAIEWAKKYGPVIRLRKNFRTIVLLNDFESIRKFCNRKELLYHSTALLLFRERNQGIGLLNGKEWSENRRFFMNMLRHLGFANTPMENSMMEEVVRVAETFGKVGGKPIDVRGYLLSSSFKNVTSFVYGARFSHDHPTMRELHGTVAQLAADLQSGHVYEFHKPAVRRLVSMLPFTRLGKIAQGLAKLDVIAEKQVLAYKESSCGNERRDFILGYLQKIEEDKEERKCLFTDEYLVGNITSFLTAGTLSTAGTLAWGLFQFAKNVDTVQARVQREVDDVVGPHRQPSWEDRKQMPFTLACVWELYRWATATVTGVPREATEDMVIGDFFIPKGTVVLPNIWAVHHDPTLWKNPNNFDPHRFLNEDGTSIRSKPEYLIPFSIGRRACPGETFATMEIFLLLSLLVQKYRIVSEHPMEYNCDATEIPWQCLNNMKLRFLPREVRHS
ncbi:cytochrome P450 2C20-like [Dermacentor variabilis]|uniref:cytochrome P450 2C20-like n=1 Tax=Dermacentor variabilis TaxID=34621 RepID=UPI003F5C54F6